MPAEILQNTFQSDFWFEGLATAGGGRCSDDAGTVVARRRTHKGSLDERIYMLQLQQNIAAYTYNIFEKNIHNK